MTTDTIPARLFAKGKSLPDKPAYHVRKGGAWEATTWSQYADQVRAASRALMGLGLEVGQTTCILGFNRPEWAVFDLATMAVGGAPAGIYTTCSPSEVQYIIAHTEAPVVLVENHDQWSKVKQERERLPALKYVVLMDGAEAVDDPMVLTWEAFLARGEAVEAGAVDARLEALDKGALATFIYTSGTTGPPKGVMLSHHNLTWTADCSVGLVDALQTDTSLSYLPLSHIAEQMFTLHVPITTGSSVYFAESIDKVKDNLVEVQPTLLFAVPRIWEKFYAAVSSGLESAPPLRQKIAGWATSVGRRTNELRNQGKEPGGLLGLQYRLANKLVFSKLKPKLGLGNVTVCVSGAAPIAAEIIEFFAGLDIVIREVYGQSEDCGPTTFNSPGKTRFGSVGTPLPGVEVRIADDDEILVRGPNVFMGYYKDEEATADTLIDGWLHSGDLGKFDAAGFLHITGRKKDIIITAGGKNIAPKNLEAAIKNHAAVGEAVVIGDRRKYLTALVSLDPDAAVAWAEAHGESATGLHESEKLRADLDAWIQTMNQEFARVEQIKKFTVLERALSIEDGELTPTMKVKRNVVHAHFADQIEAMYAE
ncbi:MAG TPA: long-chain fatty acid--CoA ligase [Deltaproteobacteria bacterium]|nr:long-chain fatty acid--CoA ligase [Deltaproteobacteria bacterium]HCP45757.1 long-chain fatty acid--CoA ligase [Deltaproteobacteria bacterium]